MCDYSTGIFVKRRKAKVGDNLVTHVFNSRHQSTGCIFAGKTATAVCLLPGTNLIIGNVPKAIRDKYALPQNFEATFAQRRVHDASPEMHRDCLLIQRNLDGKPTMFLLKELGPNVWVKVDSLSKNRKEGDARFTSLEMERINRGEDLHPFDREVYKATESTSPLVDAD